MIKLFIRVVLARKDCEGGAMLVERRQVIATIVVVVLADLGPFPDRAFDASVLIQPLLLFLLLFGIGREGA